MMDRRRYDLVLSIYITADGFAFVLFEGAALPLDWGATRQKPLGKNARSFEKLVDLIERFRPDVIVLEKIVAAATHHSPRQVKLAIMLETYLEGLGIPFFRYSRDDIKRAFAHLPSTSKDAIAEAISKMVPALFRFVPPKRKPWEGQNKRMALFDAAALALTHFKAARQIA